MEGGWENNGENIGGRGRVVVDWIELAQDRNKGGLL